MSSASTATSHKIQPEEPERLARKLFIMTMIGVCLYGTAVVIMTHFVPQDLEQSDGVTASITVPHNAPSANH